MRKILRFKEWDEFFLVENFWRGNNNFNSTPASGEIEHWKFIILLSELNGDQGNQFQAKQCALRWEKFPKKSYKLGLVKAFEPCFTHRENITHEDLKKNIVNTMIHNDFSFTIPLIFISKPLIMKKFSRDFAFLSSILPGFQLFGRSAVNNTDLGDITFCAGSLFSENPVLQEALLLQISVLQEFGLIMDNLGVRERT